MLILGLERLCMNAYMLENQYGIADRSGLFQFCVHALPYP